MEDLPTDVKCVLEYHPNRPSKSYYLGLAETAHQKRIVDQSIKFGKPERIRAFPGSNRSRRTGAGQYGTAYGCHLPITNIPVRRLTPERRTPRV